MDDRSIFKLEVADCIKQSLKTFSGHAQRTVEVLGRINNDLHRSTEMSSLPFHLHIFLIVVLSLFNRASSQVYPDKSLYQAHGWTMWLSFGLFFPIGIMVAKYGQKSGLRSSWFLLHWVIQLMGTLLATAGLIIALSQFDALGACTHTKLGLALGLLIWAQPIIGVLRPSKGRRTTLRQSWYFFHWLFGTGAVILGWFNIFKGFDIYTALWSDPDSMKVFYIGFSVQIALLAFWYLFLDRWKHLHRQ